MIQARAHDLTIENRPMAIQARALPAQKINNPAGSKGSLDPLKAYNRYGTLDDEGDGDMECDRPGGGGLPMPPRK